MKKAEEIFIVIALIIIVTIAFIIFGDVKIRQNKALAIAETRVEQEAIEKELWEKQKAYDDSVLVVRQREDSLKLEAVAKRYGQTFKTIQSALGTSCSVETITTWCQMAGTYGIQCVVDEIRGQLSSKCDVKELERRSKYQKRCGRERANKIISACEKSFMTDWNDVELISRRQVAIGFTKEQCRLAWGNPKDINRYTGVYGTTEQWCYSGYNYLYFDDDILTSYQNH